MQERSNDGGVRINVSRSNRRWSKLTQRGKMLSSSSSQKAKGGGESWLLLRRGALNRLSLESATTGKALSVNDMTPSLLTANQNYCLGESRMCLRRRCDFIALVLQVQSLFTL